MNKNENVIKRGRGRRPTYLTEEDRKDAIKKQQSQIYGKKTRKKSEG